MLKAQSHPIRAHILNILSEGPIITTILKQISEDTGRAMIEGKFSVLPDSHLSRSPIELDQAGWLEVVDALEEVLDTILDHARSAERSQRSGEDLMAARVVIMQFPIGRNRRGSKTRSERYGLGLLRGSAKNHWEVGDE